MKGILTKEHIAMIEKEAQNPIYRVPEIISFSLGTNNPLALLKITQKGLIFIKGTDDTGFTHIYQRHSENARKEYWGDFKDNKGNVVEKKDSLGRKKLRLDNPSKFHPHSIPIIDYLNIADQIYEERNLNTEKNKSPDLFDVYDGMVSEIDKKEIKYRLITYKDSKIVHTIFPHTKDFNKQKTIIINLSRQNPSSALTLLNNDFQVEIPYLDEYGFIRYVIIIRNDPLDNTKEKWFIQVNAPSGKPILTSYFGSRDKEINIGSEEYLRWLDHVDLSELENIMKRIEASLRPI
ncbi:MAG: hypothetical protein ACO1OF_07165 [Adhaeribacter sp.]